MPKLNPLAVAKLKAAAQKDTSLDIFCRLEVLGTGERFDFILNPSSINQSVAANYNSLPSAGTNIPRLQYRYGEAIEITLDGLIMMSPQHKSSLKPLLDAAVKLTRCEPDNKKYSAPVCAFVWGSRRISACVVKSFNFKETMWNADGDPVHAEGSMSLTEVIDERPTQTSTGSTQQNSPKLSSRELESGSKGAISWVKSNPLSLPKDLQQRVKLGQYRIKTDTTNRSISITDPSGKILTTIGTNERGVFKPK
jgi:hypothetical protein